MMARAFQRTNGRIEKSKWLKKYTIFVLVSPTWSFDTSKRVIFL
jgi:hypothetical protein